MQYEIAQVHPNIALNCVSPVSTHFRVENTIFKTAEIIKIIDNMFIMFVNKKADLLTSVTIKMGVWL